MAGSTHTVNSWLGNRKMGIANRPNPFGVGQQNSVMVLV